MILDKVIAFISACRYVQGLFSDIGRIGGGKSFFGEGKR